MNPTIGLFVTVDAEKNRSAMCDYVHAIEEAGATPLLLPYTLEPSDVERYAGLLDGFLFTGGVDIDPTYYGEEALPGLGEVSHPRDEAEMLAFPIIYQTGKPIMGICRGAQLINVALGGSLYQDIPSQLGESFPHRQTAPKYDYAHSATVLEGTPLAALIGAGEHMINSFHHQSVKKAGKGLEVMAVAPDGVIEALYSKEHPYLMAYQWHPERLCARDEGEMRLFIDLVENARKGI